MTMDVEQLKRGSAEPFCLTCSNHYPELVQNNSDMDGAFTFSWIPCGLFCTIQYVIIPLRVRLIVFLRKLDRNVFSLRESLGNNHLFWLRKCDKDYKVISEYFFRQRGFQINISWNTVYKYFVLMVDLRLSGRVDWGLIVDRLCWHYGRSSTK